MASLTRRRPEREDDGHSSSSNSPSPSVHSSNADLKGLANQEGQKKTLRDRSKVPPSIYIAGLSTLLLQYCSGLWNFSTLESYLNSMTISASAVGNFVVENFRSVARKEQDPLQLLKALLVSTLALSLAFVFVWAPFRAGMWTGRRAKRHQFHRYMGLLYMVQYFFAWVEFGTNYENSARDSVVPHFIAVNGLLQGLSAFISFRVLPELNDAGYFSDKAVLSRNFVHENIFFTLMVVFGSMYYNDDARESLRSSLLGRAMETAFVFFPYVMIRTWFPITRFKDAGQTHKGRTARNEQFYRVSTLLIKIFFLWAKYFLGFYINFLVYLDVVTERNWKFLNGLYLLNEGTVSLAMFLHTLRFKKVLPPRVTMAIYLAQIYLTFSAIPLAYELFSQHLLLCGTCLAGLLCNMTRSRKVHACWCVAMLVLLVGSDYTGLAIEW